MKRGSNIFSLIVVGLAAAAWAMVTKRMDDKDFDERLDEALEERGFKKQSKEEEA